MLSKLTNMYNNYLNVKLVNISDNGKNLGRVNVIIKIQNTFLERILWQVCTKKGLILKKFNNF